MDAAPNQSNPFHRAWSRLRVALTSAVIVFIAAIAMLTTNAPRRIDRGAFAIFEDAWVPGILAAGVAYALIRYHERIRAQLNRVPRSVLDLVVFAASMAFTLRFTFRAFGGWPQIQDEIAYDLLARRIAEGHPIPTSHPLYEFFRIRFMVDDGRNYVLFQPGWPLVLAFFHKIHHPQMAPAFAVGCLTLGTSRLAERVYGRFTSLLAAALVMSSGFVNVVGCAYFAHAWAAALLVLSLERLWAALTEEDPKRALRAAIVSGLFGAWLVVTRLPTALTLIVAAIVAIVGLSVRRRQIVASARRPLVALAIAFSLGPIAQMGWNLATTRHSFELPQDKYFNQTEPVPGCHRLGFGVGIGCPREHPLDTPKGGYTVARAAIVTGMRWAVFRTDAWGTPWPLALFGLLFLRKWRTRDTMIVAATVTPIAIYFGFYYHAIQHGARLWADMMGPLSVGIAAGALGVFEKPLEHDEKASRLHMWASAIAMVILVLVIHDEHTRDLPDRLVNLNRERQAERVHKFMEAGKIHGSVVYVNNCTEPDRGDVVYGWASVLNKSVPETGDRFIVRDFGEEHDRQMVTMMPTWKHMRVDCNGHPMGFGNPTPSPRHIVSELEAKFPPDDRAGCYAAIRPLANASNKQVLEIRTTAPGAWATFRQYVFETGTYDVRIAFARRPDSGKFTLAIDGKALDILDARGGQLIVETVAAAVLPLTAGTHTIEFRSLEGPGIHYFSIDRLELSKRD